MIRNNKGQSLYYFLIFTLVIVISWAMMLNIAKLIRDRMIMQNLADSTALSIATHKARTMNIVGNLNYLIGTVLSLGTDPDIAQIISYDTDKIGAYITGDVGSGIGVGSGRYNDVMKIKKIVDGLQTAQEAAMANHLIYITSVCVRLAGDGYLLIPHIDPKSINPEKYFGLKRNMKGINYLTTYNLGNGNVGDLHIVFNPIPFNGGAFQQYFKILYQLFPKLKEAINNKTKGKKITPYGQIAHEKKEYSWYIVDEENFYKQKIKISLTKMDDNKSKKPFFYKLFEIKNPFLPTMYSAASIYNTKGTMFPSKESTFTGIPDLLLTIPYEALFARESGRFIKAVFNADVTPYKVLTVAFASYIGSNQLFNATIGLLRGNDPISAFNNAKTGGWAAHLVPYNTDTE